MQYKFQMLLLDKVRHLDILKARVVMELFSFLMDIWLHVAANVNQSLEIILRICTANSEGTELELSK